MLRRVTQSLRSCVNWRTASSPRQTPYSSRSCPHYRAESTQKSSPLSPSNSFQFRYSQNNAFLKVEKWCKYWVSKRIDTIVAVIEVVRTGLLRWNDNLFSITILKVKCDCYVLWSKAIWYFIFFDNYLPYMINKSFSERLISLTVSTCNRFAPVVNSRVIESVLPL